MEMHYFHENRPYTFGILTVKCIRGGPHGSFCFSRLLLNAKIFFTRFFFLNEPTFHCATYGDIYIYIFFLIRRPVAEEMRMGPRGTIPHTPMGWSLTKIKINIHAYFFPHECTFIQKTQ